MKRERASELRGGGGEAEGGERGTLTDDAQPRSWGRTAGSSRMGMPVWLSADDLNTRATSEELVALRRSARSRKPWERGWSAFWWGRRKGSPVLLA